MSNIWCVQPETDRIEGLVFNEHVFWIEIKRELTKGEKQRVLTAGFRGYSGFGDEKTPAKRGDPARMPEIGMDWVRQSFARTETYLVDWSLSDDKGNKLPLTRDTIEALHEGVYDVIENAITAHVERRELEKKAPTGELRPRAISA